MIFVSLEYSGVELSKGFEIGDLFKIISLTCSEWLEKNTRLQVGNLLHEAGDACLVKVLITVCLLNRNFAADITSSGLVLA
jgi:hypothetical protein